MSVSSPNLLKNSLHDAHVHTGKKRGINLSSTVILSRPLKGFFGKNHI